MNFWRKRCMDILVLNAGGEGLLPFTFAILAEGGWWWQMAKP
jgi:hypothetical protein